MVTSPFCAHKVHPLRQLVEEALRWDTFPTMLLTTLTSNLIFQESENSTITFPEDDPWTMWNVVRYIYTYTYTEKETESRGMPSKTKTQNAEVHKNQAPTEEPN